MTWRIGRLFSITPSAVFLYVAMLLILGKAAGIGLDYYGFRLEHRLHLSNQKLPFMDVG